MKNNEPTTEQLKLQKYLEEHLEEGETVLWQGKQDMKIYFREEKVVLFYGPLFLYTVPFMFAYLMDHDFFTFIFFVLCLVVGFCVNSIPWFERKRNKLFAITNKNIYDVFIHDSYNKNDITLHKRNLNEIIYYEVRRSKNGGNLYLGRKRIRIGSPFIYVPYNDERDLDGIKYHTFSNYMNHINYFCFFDLADVDTPAALIKQYTNATEYIDPKQREREEKMNKRQRRKHEKQ